jgi:hypothetical protein
VGYFGLFHEYGTSLSDDGFWIFTARRCGRVQKGRPIERPYTRSISTVMAVMHRYLGFYSDFALFGLVRSAKGSKHKRV